MNSLKPRLIDREELLELYPALASKGKNKFYRLQWLTRSRQIPVIRIGRRLYFDVTEIEAWLDSKRVHIGVIE